jgi:hypothetical protein
MDAIIIRDRFIAIRKKSISIFRFNKNIKKEQIIPNVIVVDRAIPFTPKRFIKMILSRTFKIMDKQPMENKGFVSFNPEKKAPLINVYARKKRPRL